MLRGGAVEIVFDLNDAMEGCDLLGEDSMAPHPGAELGVVEPPAPDGADAVQGFFFPSG